MAQVTTADADELTWEVESGDWTVVVMNADASRGVDVDARFGIKVDWFLPVAIAGIVAGVILLAGGAALAIVGGRGLARAPNRTRLRPPTGWPPPDDRDATTDRTTATSTTPARGAVPATTERSPRPRPEPRPVAGQVAAGHPALHRARLLVDRLRRRQRHRLLRHPVHRSLPTWALRLQRRGAPLELAGRLLLLQRARHRPLPTLQPATRPTTRPSSPCLPRASLPRIGARQVVAAGDPPLPHHRRSSAAAGGSAGGSRPTPAGPASPPG